MTIFSGYKIKHNFTGRKAHNLSYLFKDLKDTVWIEKDDRNVDGKSILGLLSLNLSVGDIIDIRTSGTKKEIEKIIGIFEGDET